MPRVLVLGAGGRAGTRLRRGWADLAPDTQAVFQSRRAEAGVDLVLDPALSGMDGLVAAMRTVAPDLVLCLWGAVVVPGSVPRLEDNRDLACLAYAAAGAANVPHVAALSSGIVYGTRPGAAFDEGDVLAGTTPYARSKIAMEQALAEAARHPDAPGLTCLRLANLAGADMLAGAARQASAAAPLRLDRFADGRGPVRSYASTRTLAGLAAALAREAGRDLPRVLNVVDGEQGHAMGDLLDALGRQGHPVPWVWQDAPPDALPRHVISGQRLAERFPALRAVFCDSPDALARDWADLEGDRP